MALDIVFSLDSVITAVGMVSHVGVMLIVEGFGNHGPKGYIYFAMAFSLLVELLNKKAGARAKPVELRGRYADKKDPAAAPGPERA